MLVRCLVALASATLTVHAAVKISGERKLWHRLTLTFDGPKAAEDGVPNPFRDFRLTVTFTHASGKQHSVPGFFAADGRAAETSARSGNQWRVHFTPDEVGVWRFRVSFRTGPDVALTLDPQAGTPLPPTG
jgi:hypothetical protein